MSHGWKKFGVQNSEEENRIFIALNAMQTLTSPQRMAGNIQVLDDHDAAHLSRIFGRKLKKILCHNQGDRYPAYRFFGCQGIG